MLAARDQENRLFAHSVRGAAGRHHALGPKTPMKVPLNDTGNGTTRLAGGKSVLGSRPNGGNENLRTVGKAGKSNLVTPLEPRTARAPLGNKTTNAKAHIIQQHHQNQAQKTAKAGGVKDIVREIENSQKQQQQPQPPPASTRRPRVISPRANAFKLSVLSDDKAVAKGAEDGKEEDIEYAPPPVPAEKYVSDVFPEGVLTFAAFRPENRLRGYYDHYYNPVDDDGVPLREKEFQERQRRAFEKLDIRVQEDMDAFDWSIGDVPASKEYFANIRKQQLLKQQQQQQQAAASSSSSSTRAAQPPTLASRSAASALALASNTTSKPTNAAITATKTKPTTTARANDSSLLSVLPLRKQQRAGAGAPSALPLRPKSTNHPVAETASRTTLGYNKGRTASSIIRGSKEGNRNTATVRNASSIVHAPAASRPGPSTGVSAAPTFATPIASRTPQSGLEDDSTNELEVEPRSPAFLSIFDATTDDQEDLGGPATYINDDLDDDFQMDIKF